MIYWEMSLSAKVVILRICSPTFERLQLSRCPRCCFVVAMYSTALVKTQARSISCLLMRSILITFLRKGKERRDLSAWWMDVVLSCQAQWPEPTRKYHNSCLFWSFTLITDGVSFLHYQDVPSKLVSHFYDWGHCALQPALWTCLCWQLKIGLRHPLTSELQTCIDSWVFI